MKLCICQNLGLSDGKHHFESGECPLNKPDCDPAKLAEATELRRRLFGKGRGRAKKQNANVWESTDLCPCCDDEADGDLDGPTSRPRATERRRTDRVTPILATQRGQRISTSRNSRTCPCTSLRQARAR